MRRFNYRLERLLRYRSSLTQRERVRLARRAAALAAAEDNASRLRGVRNATKIEHIRALKEGTTSRQVSNLLEHLVRVGEAIEHADEGVHTAEGEVEKARTKVVERRRDQKAIEMHRERRFKTWLRDYYRDETRILDDLATIQHVRRLIEQG